MIKKEFYTTREDGVNLYRTYSDANFYIRKVGTDEVYLDAVDIETANYQYEETDTQIEQEEVNGYDYRSSYPQKVNIDNK